MDKTTVVREGKAEYYVWRKGPCRECGQERYQLSDSLGTNDCVNGCLP